MGKLELINQPFNGQLGERLIALMSSRQFVSLDIVVAFAKNSGVLRLKEALEQFRKEGGTVNVFVGVDLGGTSYEALTNLAQCVDELHIVHSETSQTFHPKVYKFTGKKNAVVIVGSHNLTAGGLWTNFESALITHFDMTADDSNQTLEQMDYLLQKLRFFGDLTIQITGQAQIDELLKNGYVEREVVQQIRISRESDDRGPRTTLFGKRKLAPLPSVQSGSKVKVAIPVEPLDSFSDSKSIKLGPTIWFETRKMTGGSRNILDLSKKSMVEAGDPSGTAFDLGEPGYMRGAVQFFGMDPADVNTVKDITINYNGTDYAGNTVLFPVGERANGTWRLQIKGLATSGQKITDVINESGGVHQLVNKVLTFTKISSNYFYMSIFPDTDLEKFKSSSALIARNGVSSQAKLLGVLRNG